MVKINFSYTDEFNQETTLTKTLTEDVFEISTTFEMLVDEFKNFMLASGFSRQHVDSIVIKED